MKIQIHQIQAEKDKKHLCFMNYDHIMKNNAGIIPKSIYDCVFTGEVNAENLEDVFRIFNIEHPKDYTGRSLSISDVVEIQYEDYSEFFFCDSIGFKMIIFDKNLIGCELIKTLSEKFMTSKEYHKYILSECEKQWKDDNEETMGVWSEQSDDTKADYYNDMYSMCSDILGKCCADCKYYSENGICSRHKLGVNERNFCDNWANP